MKPGAGPAGDGWMTPFIRNSGLLMGSNGLQSLIAFASQLVLMRLLTPVDFGGFAITLATASLVQVIFSPRLGILAIRATEAELTDAFRHRLLSAMTIETLVSLALMVLWLTLMGAGSVWPYLLALTLASAHWISSVTMFYERAMPYRRLIGVETGAQLAAHAVAVLLALAGAGVASLYVREAAAVAVRIVWLGRIGAIPRWRPRMVALAEWRALLIEARGPWLDGIVDGGFQRLTVLAAGSLGGLQGAGLFFQAQRLALVPHQILSPVVVRLAGNVFSRIETPSDRRRMLGRVIAVLALPLGAAAVATWIGAEPVVPWLFGESWREAGSALAAMTGIVLGFSLFELGRSYCLSQKLNRLLGLARVVQYGVFAGGCLLLADGGSAVELGAVLSAVYLASATVVLIGLTAGRGGR